MVSEKENKAAEEKKLSASKSARKLKNGENKRKAGSNGMDSLDKALAKQEHESLKPKILSCRAGPGSRPGQER